MQDHGRADRSVVWLSTIRVVVMAPAPSGVEPNAAERGRLDLGSGWEHRALKGQYLAAWQLVGERP